MSQALMLWSVRKYCHEDPSKWAIKRALDASDPALDGEVLQVPTDWEKRRDG